MPIKLIAVDLDDTLLDKSGAVSPRTRAAIAAALANGVTVTIATGRMYRSAAPFARQLGLDVPLITYNGALIKSSLSGEVLYHRPLAERLAHQVLELFRRNSWYIQSYLDDVLYVRELDAKAQWYAAFAKVEAVPAGESFYTMPGAPTKLLSLGDPETIREICREVRKEFGAALSAVISKPQFLEMIDPGVGKGRALDFLAARLGISRAEVMAVGDSENDLDLLEHAGLAVAMGNASAELKARADAVTAANDADGVAEAIERYVLCGD